jgi:hypothetical protein
VRAGAAAAAAIALGVAAGCGGSGDRERRADTAERTPPPRRATSDAAVVRGWIGALNAGDYDRAASYFSPGAIVEQGQRFRLRDRAAAETFNRGLPCRADIEDVEDEGATTLVAFDLRRGPGPMRSCGGSARVRFRVRDGRFTQWLQLPERPTGDVA